MRGEGRLWDQFGDGHMHVQAHRSQRSIDIHHPIPTSNAVGAVLNGKPWVISLSGVKNVLNFTPMFLWSEWISDGTGDHGCWAKNAILRPSGRWKTQSLYSSTITRKGRGGYTCGNIKLDFIWNKMWLLYFHPTARRLVWWILLNLTVKHVWSQILQVALGKYFRDLQIIEDVPTPKKIKLTILFAL